MVRWKKVAIVVASLVLALVALVLGYKLHYSMRRAPTFEVVTPDHERRVLIATQGSEFKDAVVSGLVDRLKHRPVYIKVIDVSSLPAVNEGDWSAIVIIHTWENGEPPLAVKAFLEHVGDRRKVVVLTTSGRGDRKMAGVDAITSASTLSEAPERAAAIMTRLDSVLGGGAALRGPVP